MSNVVTIASEGKWLDTADEVLQSNVTRVLESTGTASSNLAELLARHLARPPAAPYAHRDPYWGLVRGHHIGCGRIGKRRALEHGADAAVTIGLLGALPTAAAGLMDWQHTQGRARRTGALHGVLNISATGLFATSLLARVSDARGLGCFLASAGYGAIMAAGYLGGELVYRERVGVDHAERPEPSDTFTAVLAESELAEGQARRVEVDGVGVLVAKTGGRVCAIGEVCAHLGGPLAEGEVEDGAVTCPWHGSRFDLTDGRVLDGPSTFPQSRYETRIQNGQIEVRPAAETA